MFQQLACCQGHNRHSKNLWCPKRSMFKVYNHWIRKAWVPNWDLTMFSQQVISWTGALQILFHEIDLWPKPDHPRSNVAELVQLSLAACKWFDHKKSFGIMPAGQRELTLESPATEPKHWSRALLVILTFEIYKWLPLKPHCISCRIYLKNELTILHVIFFMGLSIYWRRKGRELSF